MLYTWEEVQKCIAYSNYCIDLSGIDENDTESYLYYEYKGVFYPDL
jgi:hypothetical protein